MDEIVQLFTKLVSIPSPSGKEMEVGTYIKHILSEAGIESDFDGTGGLNDSNAGNLIARLPGDRPKTILFVAHMDTVETGETPIKPKIENGIIKSDGTTILGADNKGSVAALIEALKELKKNADRPAIVAAFTTREETGVMGSSVLNLPDKIDFAFNLDGQEPIGRVIYQTLGEIPFTIQIRGKASHAASAPQKGINAMLAAAEVITRLPIGRTEAGKVLNIGKIKGGTGNNVVPDLVEMTGQARAFTQTEIQEVLTELGKTLETVCAEKGCSFTLTTEENEGAPPSSLPQIHPIIEVAKQAAESAGLPFSLEKGYFCSDANFLSAKYPTITVVRGSSDPHSVDEAMPVAVLQSLQKLVVALALQVR